MTSYSTHQEIVPSNITSDGKLSYYNGQPTVQFLLGEQDRMLLPGSLRVVGEFTVWKDAAGTTLPTEADKIRMNERLGINAVIDQLTIFSQKSGQVMETINHHNRMMSSYLSVTQSFDDLLLIVMYYLAVLRLILLRLRMLIMNYLMCVLSVKHRFHHLIKCLV